MPQRQQRTAYLAPVHGGAGRVRRLIASPASLLLVLTRSALQVGLLVLAATAAVALWRTTGASLPQGDPLLGAVALLVVLQQVGLRAFRVHRRSWRFTSLGDVVAIAAGLTTGTVAAGMLAVGTAGLALPVAGLPTGLLALDAVLALNLLVLGRVTRRLLNERRRARSSVRSGADLPTDRGPLRAIVIGGGRVGVGVVRDAQLHHGDPPRIVGILSDELPVGELVAGAPVLGGTAELESAARRHDANLVIVALDRDAPGRLRTIVGQAQRLGLPVRIRSAEPLAGIDEAAPVVRGISIADLLPRPANVMDTSGISRLVAGRTVLVTGAAGSIGSELARQLLRHGPSRLVLVDRSEYGLWQLEQELAGLAPIGVVRPVLLDLRERALVNELLRRHSPSVVFHAAALKHVPLVEQNVASAVLNNVLATHWLVEAALANGVNRFVLVSSDKAVTPTSVMGATKRLAERLVADAAARSGHDYVSVRFGNVLGSSGSVLEVFQQQLAAGGPLTVTDPEMTRFFMTIPEACGLVLHAATQRDRRGTVVLDMGEPVRILDVAEDLIRLHGLEPGVDVDITITGARPGEKLHEELAAPSEQLVRTDHPAILAIRGSGGRWPERDQVLVDLRDLARLNSADLLREMVLRVAAEPTGDDVPSGDVRPAGRPDRAVSA